MFVRLSRSVVQKLFKHSEGSVTWPCLYSSNRGLTTSTNQPGLNKTELENKQTPEKHRKSQLEKMAELKNTQTPEQHRKSHWEKMAEKFLFNLSEELLLEKQHLDIDLEIMRQKNLSVPDEITPIDWMILLTECKTSLKKLKYLDYLYNREQYKIKKQMIKDRNAAKDKMKDSYEGVFCFQGISRNKQINRWKSSRALQSDINVIIDFGFDLCTQDQRCVYHHLEMLLAENRNHPQPLRIHITSIDKNYRLQSDMQCHNETYAYLHYDRFLDIFPHKDLVYLSPDGPPMKEFNPNYTYILGGIGDFNDEKDMTLKLARDHGLRCVSFPIKDYFSGPPTYNLRMNYACGILLDMYLHNSWKEAFMKNLPPVYTLRPDVATLNDSAKRLRWLSKADPNKIINILNRNRLK